MVTRLSASDASFYHLENTSTPMYVGSLSILRKPRNGLSYETLLATVEQRLPQIPRYRQKVREVTLGLARPVWVDDRDFDITYHIRRSALPSPGSDAQLHELVARLGLAAAGQVPAAVGDVSGRGPGPNRIAIYTKSHQALVNGMTALEIGHVIADRTQKPPAVRRGHLDPGARAERRVSCCSAPSVSGSPGPAAQFGGRALGGHRGGDQRRAAGRGRAAGSPTSRAPSPAAPRRAAR